MSSHFILYKISGRISPYDADVNMHSKLREKEILGKLYSATLDHVTGHHIIIVNTGLWYSTKRNETSIVTCENKNHRSPKLTLRVCYVN